MAKYLETECISEKGLIWIVMYLKVSKPFHGSIVLPFLRVQLHAGPDPRSELGGTAKPQRSQLSANHHAVVHLQPHRLQNRPPRDGLRNRSNITHSSPTQFSIIKMLLLCTDSSLNVLCQFISYM